MEKNVGVRGHKRGGLKSKHIIEYVDYEGKTYPIRVITVNGRGYYIGGEYLRFAMDNGNGDIKADHATLNLDSKIFHYVDDDLIKRGSDEAIIKEIELDDVPRSDW